MNIMALTQDPETIQVLTSMLMVNLEGEGLQDVREYFRKRLVLMGVTEPSEQEAEEMAAQAANAQPNAQEQYLQAAAAEAMAKAQKAQADTVYTSAKAQETQAKTVETLARLDMDQQKQAVETAKDINEIVRGG